MRTYINSKQLLIPAKKLGLTDNGKELQNIHFMQYVMLLMYFKCSIRYIVSNYDPVYINFALALQDFERLNNCKPTSQQYRNGDAIILSKLYDINGLISEDIGIKIKYRQ